MELNTTQNVGLFGRNNNDEFPILVVTGMKGSVNLFHLLESLRVVVFVIREPFGVPE